MVKQFGDSYEGKLDQFIIMGRETPSQKNPNPTVFKMNIFAKDVVQAKSRFWYFVRRLKRVKRSAGEIVSCEQLPEPEITNAKTYGILIRYESRTGIHNIYKEYRAVSVTDAVSKMYQDMAGRHQARKETIYIVKASEVTNLEDMKREYTRQFADHKVKFPHIWKKYRPHSQFKKTFVAKRPTVFSI